MLKFFIANARTRLIREHKTLLKEGLFRVPLAFSARAARGAGRFVLKRAVPVATRFPRSFALAFVLDRTGSALHLLEGWQEASTDGFVWPTPEQARRNCKIHVLDPAKELAIDAGVPVCDLNSSTFWPHSEEGKGIQSMARTHHYEHQHGGGYWLSRALVTSAEAVDDPAKADVTFLDMHCYHSWFISMARRRESLAEPTAAITAMIEKIVESPLGRNGASRLGLYLPIPATVGIYGAFLGRTLRHATTFVLETGFLGKALAANKLRDHEAMVLPYSSIADIDPTLPMNEDKRDVLLFMRAGCSDKLDRSAGILMRGQLARALVNSSSADVDAECACSTCPNRLSHPEVQERMRKSRFCPVLAGDTQASARLTEVILAGCIPVFVGPPWHTLPLQDLIDWRDVAVFVNVTDTSSYEIVVEHRSNLVSWARLPTVDVFEQARQVRSLGEVEGVLREISHSEVDKKAAALDAIRPLFWYPPYPATGVSAVGEAIIDKLCEAAMRENWRDVRREKEEKKEKRLQARKAIQDAEEEEQAKKEARKKRDAERVKFKSRVKPADKDGNPAKDKDKDRDKGKKKAEQDAAKAKAKAEVTDKTAVNGTRSAPAKDAKEPRKGAKDAPKKAADAAAKKDAKDAGGRKPADGDAKAKATAAGEDEAAQETVIKLTESGLVSTGDDDLLAALGVVVNVADDKEASKRPSGKASGDADDKKASKRPSGKASGDADVKAKATEAKAKAAEAKEKPAEAKEKPADAEHKAAAVKEKEADAKIKAADAKTRLADAKAKVEAKRAAQGKPKGRQAKPAGKAKSGADEEDEQDDELERAKPTKGAANDASAEEENFQEDA